MCRAVCWAGLSPVERNAMARSTITVITSKQLMTMLASIATAGSCSHGTEVAIEDLLFAGAVEEERPTREPCSSRLTL